MAVRPRYIKQEETPKTDQGDPSLVLTLLYLSGQGIVFRSRQFFDTGTKLAMGLHLDKVRGDLGLSKAEGVFSFDPYLNLQGFVADCKLTEMAGGVVTYQVTLLFNGLEEVDEILIESIERELRLRSQQPVLSAARRDVEPGLN